MPHYMTTAQQHDRISINLDPFTFPTDTTFKFVLLLFCVVGSSLFIHHMFYYQNSENMLREIDAMFRNSAVEMHQKEGSAVPNNPLLSKSARDELVVTIGRAKLLWMTGGQLLLFGVSFSLFFFYPRFKRWRNKLEPLTVEDATPELMDFLHGLCQEAELRRHPVFLWNPLNQVSTAVAFGTSKRYYIALSGGLVTKFFTNRAAFRAILLHELAHIKNRDVDKTYFTIAVWQAFVLVALIPASVGLLFFGVGLSRSTVKFPFQVLALTLLVYIMRNAVLRSREIYADLRATKWEGPGGVIGELLQSLPNQNPSVWKQPFLVHPSPLKRYQTLRDQRELFKFGFWTTFGTGFAVPIALSNLVPVLASANMAGVLVGGAMGSLLVIAVVALPVSIMVVIGVWRMTLLRLDEGVSYLKGTMWIPLVLGVGVTVGNYFAFSFSNTVDSLVARKNPIAILIGADSFESISLSSAISLEAGSFLLGIVYFFLLIRWVAASASVWLSVSTTLQVARSAALAGAIIGGTYFSLALTVVFSARESLFSTLRTEAGLSPLAAFLSPSLAAQDVAKAIPLGFLLVIVFSLWAFPLSAQYWLRARQGTGETTATLAVDQRPDEALDASGRGLYTVTVSLIGGACGLLFLCLLLLINLAALAAVNQGQMTSQERVELIWLEVFLSIPVQVLAAALAAFWVKRWGTLHGLCAAFAAASVSGLGIVVFAFLFTGTLGQASVFEVLVTVIFAGVTSSTVASFLSAKAGNWIRKRRSTTVQATNLKSARLEILPSKLTTFLRGHLYSLTTLGVHSMKKVGIGGALFAAFIIFQVVRLVDSERKYNRLLESRERYLTMTDPVKNYNLGLSYLEAKNYSQAASAFEQVVRRCDLVSKCVQPTRSQALVRLGYTHLQLQMIPQAIDELGEAVLFDSTLTDGERVEAHKYLGHAYLRNAEYDEAIKELSEALKLKPDDADVVYDLGTAYVLSDRPKLAQEQMATLTKLGSPLANELKGKIHVKK